MSIILENLKLDDDSITYLDGVPLTKEELKQLVKRKSIDAISIHFGVRRAKVIRVLKKSGAIYSVGVLDLTFSDKEIAEEVWVTPQYLGGDYDVSSLGRVRVRRIMKNGDTDTSILLVDRYGKVTIRKDKNRSQVYVKDLVAKEFLTPEEGKPFVSWKDEVKTNNRLTNLIWSDKDPRRKINYIKTVSKRGVNLTNRIEGCSDE